MIGRSSCGGIKLGWFEHGGREEGTDTLPPRSLALSVTTTEPSQTITKTPVKIWRDCSGGAGVGLEVSCEQRRRGEECEPFMERRTARARQNCEIAAC